MDNDILQDSDGNVINPENGVLDSEIENRASGDFSPDSDTDTGDFDIVDPDDKDITDKGDPILPGGGGGSDPGSGTDPEPESGSGTVLIPEQKIPTNSEIQVSIRKLAGRKPDFTEYYDWSRFTPEQTEDYCPTRYQIQANIQDPLKVSYLLNNIIPGDQCPTAGELADDITVNGKPIEPPGKPIPTP